MAHAIEVRRVAFEFTDGIAPVWHPKRREWSHMINGASLVMPYLEPFLNRTLREALAGIDDPELRQDVDGFVRQEAQHYANHRRYNEMLKANGYAELAAVEKTYEADYQALERCSLDWRLAYAAGFETMTMGITEWLVNDREALFADADPTVASLVLWHMVEETEHKSVAFDVYQAVCGRYWLRVAGLIRGSFHVGFMARRGYVAMLKKDGVWYSLPSRLRTWAVVARFFVKAGAAMVRALSPRYHPDRIDDPAWVAQWRQAYARQGGDSAPVLATTRRGIPPQFAGASPARQPPGE